MIESRAVDERRHEAKVILPIAQLHRLSMWLRHSRADFSPIFHSRWINNVYFDTEELTALTEAIEGDSRRVKVRLRWYGELDQASKSALEFKCKVGSLGWKIAYDVDEPIQLSSQSWREMMNAIRTSVPAEGRTMLSHVSRPTMINRYWRTYFASFDRSIRVTIDQHLTSWMQYMGRKLNLRQPRRFTSHAVIEFKAAHRDAMSLAAVLGELDGRVNKYSKYVAGMVGLSQVDQRW